jgi:transcription initiation factor TFIIH subunit 2
MPSHVSKEVLILQLGLSTCDAGDITETCEQLKAQKIKTSVISLLGQVYFSENIARITGGSYEVVLNDDNFARLIMQHVLPPSMLIGEQKTLGYLVQMGFPRLEPIECEFLCLWYAYLVVCYFIINYFYLLL